MNLRPDEIAAILKTEIERYEVSAEVEEVGTVIQIGDGIARIYGLDRCVAMERLEFDHGVIGLALNLEEDNVAAVLFGDWDQIKEGDTVRRSGKVMSIPVGEAMVGRVVDPLGQPMDGRGPLEIDRDAGRWSSRRPAWSTASRSRSRCRPASRRSTR